MSDEKEDIEGYDVIVARRELEILLNKKLRSMVENPEEEYDLYAINCALKYLKYVVG